MHDDPVEEQSLLSRSREQEEQETHFRDYLLVLLKRRWMILTITLIILTIAGVRSFLQTPLYRSSASLYIDVPGAFNFVPETSSYPLNWQSYETFFNTQFKLLKSKTLGLRVVEELNLTHNDLNQYSEKGHTQTTAVPQNFSGIASTLLQMLEISPVKNTNLCEIVFVTPDPKLSMILANAWAEEYVDYSMSSQYQFTQKAAELLDQQVTGLQKEIAEKEKLLQDYSLEKRVVKLDGERSMSAETLEELNNALTTARKERIVAQVHYQELKSKGKNATPEVLSNPEIQQIRSEYANLERQYTEKSKAYKPDYPEMIRLRSQMDQTTKRLNQEGDNIYRKTLGAADSSYRQALENEKGLQQEIDLLKRQFVETNRKEVNYDRLDVEIDNKKQLLGSLLQKRNETGVSAQIKENKATTTRIIDRAEMPLSIYKPDHVRNLMFGLLFALFVGVGIAFLLEYFDRSFKGPEDVERFTGIPLLGTVPKAAVSANDNGNRTGSRALVKQQAADGQQIDLVAVHSPASITSEALKTVRTSLLLSFPEAPPSTILVTSSRAGEGKTFIACNLAAALTELNKRVALVDCDLRNPRIHKIWNVRNDAGLSRFLTGDISAETIVRGSSLDGLTLVTSGPRTPRPAELLSSSRLDDLIRFLLKSHDHVVFDSPPLMPVADSIILAAKCKCVLMVIQGGVTPRDVVQMAKKKLTRADIAIGGAILNCVDISNPYYYYSYYAKYTYGYKENRTKKNGSHS